VNLQRSQYCSSLRFGSTTSDLVSLPPFLYYSNSLLDLMGSDLMNSGRSLHCWWSSSQLGLTRNRPMSFRRLLHCSSSQLGLTSLQLGSTTFELSSFELSSLELPSLELKSWGGMSLELTSLELKSWGGMSLELTSLELTSWELTSWELMNLPLQLYHSSSQSGSTFELSSFGPTRLAVKRLSLQLR
jgi:hypothetical protein